MAKKQFKAESKKLLDLMINSIYTNREIFLRELISNASDAIDKRHYMSLTDTSLSADFKIELTPDAAARTLTITDNGCGMTQSEMETNLGTIAKSGTSEFKAANKTDESLIGQFGVGFYSSFMVADKVTVVSRKAGEEQAYKWESTGADGYTISPCDSGETGTSITLHLKEDDEDCSYGQFTDENALKRLVKKYSDYIRYPIKIKDETVNSMVPLWRKRKSEVQKEDYDRFYREKFFDYQEPANTFVAQVEGNINYSMLVFVPQKAPYDFYSRDYKKGLQLYSGGVLIMEKCADLLPDYLGFMKGLVDSPDISLNISRELLQKDRQMRAIAVSLEKKLRGELSKWLKNDREGYEKFFDEFGNALKMGAYDNFGEKKDELKDLLLFKSSENKYVTFAEYVSRLKEGQDAIYYAVGPNADAIKALPQVEHFAEKGYEILYLQDGIDEFVIKLIENYDGKKFVSVAGKDAAALTDEEKADLEQKTKDSDTVLKKIKELLSGKVKDVRLTARLKSAAVCLTSDSEISLEMEKVLRAMPGNTGVLADRVLELNPAHAAVQKTLALSPDDETLKDHAFALYSAACLNENLPIEDSASLASLLVKLLS
ncbi:MAG: molecular chaperone HtpG [Clostridiales bacterium]|nr:molecular chaperone HtpG [Clostridiales bacterium]